VVLHQDQLLSVGSDSEQELHDKDDDHIAEVASMPPEPTRAQELAVTRESAGTHKSVNLDIADIGLPVCDKVRFAYQLGYISATRMSHLSILWKPLLLYIGPANAGTVKRHGT
jgi:hypothetical protein